MKCKLWVYSFKACHLRYIEESETHDYLSTHYPDFFDWKTRVLDHEYRWYDLQHRTLTPLSIYQLQICARSHEELRLCAYFLLNFKMPAVVDISALQSPGINERYFGNSSCCMLCLIKLKELWLSSFYSCFLRTFNRDSIVFISQNYLGIGFRVGKYINYKALFVSFWSLASCSAKSLSPTLFEMPKQLTQISTIYQTAPATLPSWHIWRG